MSALLPEQEAFLVTVPPMYRGIIDRALRGENSRANAIKAKCLDCCCYVRDEVEHCTVVLCPLHAYRPRYGRSEPNSGQIDEERIADGREVLPAVDAGALGSLEDAR